MVYVAFWGEILSGPTVPAASRSVDREGVSASGGGLKIEGLSGAGMDYAVITEKGREMATYSFQVHGFDRALLENIAREINTAPIDAELNPWDSDRSTYAARAHASRPKAKPFLTGTQYFIDVEVYCREDVLYGAEQGITFRRNCALPQSASLVNEGSYEGTIDYLMVSGAYDSVLGYTDDLTVTFGGHEIRLCDQLMRGDRFYVDRWGKVEHLYETNAQKVYTALQTDLHGSSYFDIGNGSYAYEAIKLGNSAKMLFPFYGPLPISSDEPPTLEFTLTAFDGTPAVTLYTDGSLADGTDLDIEPFELGDNIIEIPDCAGHTFVAFGLTTDTSSTITFSNIKAVCKRYIAEMPMVDAGETFDFEISDGEWSNHLAEMLHAVYKDGY